MSANNTESLHKILESLIPESISYNFKFFDSTLSADSLVAFRALFPLSKTEYRDIQNAVPKREIEFRIGRFLIKNLLNISQHNTNTNLCKKPNGSPNWPPNTIGSISHSSSVCIAVIGDTKLFSGIGIDIEQGNFDSNLEKHIVQGDELSKYPGQLSYPATLRAIFCCKEAIFKSLERYLSERIDFTDVVVRFLGQSDPNIFMFNFQFSRRISGLEIFDQQQFQGKIYADEKVALSLATIK